MIFVALLAAAPLTGRGWLIEIGLIPAIIAFLAFVLLTEVRRNARCEICEGGLGSRLFLGATTCKTCHMYLVDDPRHLPAPETNESPRKNARREYRLLCSQAISDPRNADEALFDSIAGAREASGFGVGKAETETGRTFSTYVASLLRNPELQPADLQLVPRALEAMAGVRAQALEVAQPFDHIGIRLLMRCAREGWLFEHDSLPNVRLQPGEHVVYVDPVECLRPLEQKLVKELGLSGSFGVRGVAISTKTTLVRTRQLVPGELTSIGDNTLIVTDRQLLIIGQQNYVIEIEDVVAMFGWNKDCRIHARHQTDAIFVRGRDGELTVAMIEMGIRLARNPEGASGA